MFFTIKSAKFLRMFSVAIATSTLLACGGGSSPAPVTPAAITFVSGVVRNAAGIAVQGAAVIASGQSAVTGADGSFKLDASQSGDTTVVLVKKSGFTTTAKEVPLTTAGNTQIDIQLLADQVTTTFNAATATTIPVNGAQVQFPANAIKTASGADYTGTVSVGASYYSPDTVQGARAFAGPYTGIDAGVQSPIISMGFMEVKLTDADGNPLQLKAPATLTFPAASNSANAASVPLWFYDEAAAIWKREGTATRQADGTFQGTVAHFTIWNADFFGVNATIKGCFKDAAGQALTNVGTIGLRGTGYAKLLSSGGGDTAGNFTIRLVPANLPLELYSTSSPAAFTPVAIPALTASEIRTLTTCITAIAPTPGTVNVISLPTTVFTVTVATPTGSGSGTTTTTVTTPAGTVTTPVTTTTAPVTTTTPAVTGTAVFAGNYTGTYSGAEQGTFNVRISSTGLVSGTVFSQTFNQTFSVTGRVSASGGVSITASGSAGSAEFNGAVTAAGVLSGRWNYVQSTTGGTFTGNRI